MLLIPCPLSNRLLRRLFASPRVFCFLLFVFFFFLFEERSVTRSDAVGRVAAARIFFFRVSDGAALRGFCEVGTYVMPRERGFCRPARGLGFHAELNATIY